MALMQLFRWFTPCAVDHTSTFNSWPLKDRIRPTLDIRIILNAEKLCRIVLPALHHPAVLGKYRNIGNCIVLASQILGYG